jgi:hypothetical protein
MSFSVEPIRSPVGSANACPPEATAVQNLLEHAGFAAGIIPHASP